MDYIRFKRRAILSQAFSILLVDSTLVNEFEMLIVPTVANGVAFAVAYAHAGNLDVITALASAVAASVAITGENELDAFVAKLRSASLTVTLAPELVVNVVVDTANSKGLSSILSLVWGMSTTGTVALAKPFATSQALVFDISMSVPSLAHEIGTATLIALELVSSLVATAGTAVGFIASLEHTFAMTASADIITPVPMLWTDSYLFELHSALVRARATRHLAYLINANDVNATFAIAWMATLADYDPHTLSSMDGSALSYLVVYLL